MYAILLYGLAVNVFTFYLFGLDKLKAKRRERRIPEKQLFLAAALGGAAGAWIGMGAFRHKTKHVSFTLGIPALLLVNIVTLSLFIRAWG